MSDKITINLNKNFIIICVNITYHLICVFILHMCSMIVLESIL